MALSIGGKKKGFTKEDFLGAFAQNHLYLPATKVEKETKRLISFAPQWVQMIDKSFLNNDLKEKYKVLLNERIAILV